MSLRNGWAVQQLRNISRNITRGEKDYANKNRFWF